MILVGLLRWVKISLRVPGRGCGMGWQSNGFMVISLGALRGLVSRKMLLDTLEFVGSC